MSKCAICRKLITPDTDSREHLFPNAIGGRKKVAGFICRGCNSNAGEGWDADLARQLNPICLLLGIERERGKPPPQEFSSTEGQSYVHHSDGGLKLPKPIFEETEGATGKNIHITARDMGELKRILAGVKKKYPQIDEAATLKQAITEKSYPKDLLHIPVRLGGLIAGRSIVKTALALAVQSRVSVEDCEAGCAYLRDSNASAQWDFCPFDPLENRPAGVALHCVAIQAKDRKLVGYVEYFGTWRMWVPLSDHYQGPDIQASYAVNPVTGDELTLNVGVLPLNAPDSPPNVLWKQIETSLNAVLEPAMKAARERELDRVLHEAWSHASEQMKIKPGDSLSKEFVDQVVRGMTPFLEHQLHNPFAKFRPSEPTPGS